MRSSYLPEARSARQPSAEVVVVVGVGAKLLAEGGVDELRIAQVAEEEGADGDAVGVGELAPAEDHVGLGHGPPLDVLAGEEVADEPLRLLRHPMRRAIPASRERAVRRGGNNRRAVSCTARTGDGAARAGGGQRAVVEGSGQRAAGIRRAAQKQRQAGSEQEQGAAQTPHLAGARWREL